MQELSNLQTLIQTDSDGIARDQQEKTLLQSMLTALATTQPTPATSPLAAELANAETQLAMLEQVDKPTHPDVIRLQDQIQALKRQLTQGGKAGAPATVHGAVSRDQTRQQIDAMDADMHMRALEQRQQEARAKELRARLEREPAVEAALASVQRDYDIAKTNYESLLQKKNAASMAAAMEAQAEGEEFRIIDPANLPETPAKPNLPQLYIMGLVLGALGGGLLGLGREYVDGSIRTERDLAYYLLNVPLLATMPALVTQASLRQARRRRRRVIAVSSAAVCAAALGFGVYLHLHGGLGIAQWF